MCLKGRRGEEKRKGEGRTCVFARAARGGKEKEEKEVPLAEGGGGKGGTCFR